MEALRSQFAEVHEVWETVYESIRANPTNAQPHLSGIQPEQVDETVATTLKWLEQVEQPEGFQPTFHLAKAVVGTALTSLLTDARCLQKGEYNYFPKFVAGLLQITSALHTLSVFSGEVGNNGARLDGKLAETLALLDTAQRELSNKTEALKDADSTIAKAQERAEELEKLVATFREYLNQGRTVVETLQKDMPKEAESVIVKAQNDLAKLSTDIETQTAQAIAKLNSEVTKFQGKLESDSILQHEKLVRNAGSSLDAINGHAKSAALHAEQMGKQEAVADELLKLNSDLLRKNDTLLEQLTHQSKKLTEIQGTSTEQQELIANLLPKGASAGLAAAFEARADKLGPTKLLWGVAFMFSIIGLVVVAGWLAVETEGKEVAAVLIELLHRLPFAAPLVWLGWFSAIQYGNTIRVQEDYAFKAATSKAFAGYKDHMDHMANVDLGEANNAMKMLAARTIEILAHEPLRIYERSERDVSPTNSVLGRLGRRNPTNPLPSEPPPTATK